MEIATFENEMEILGFYLLKSFEIKTGKTNKQYVDLSLEDKTGQINAKIWNVEGIDPEAYKQIMAVKVKGKVKEFNGALQLNIEKIRPVNSRDGVELEVLIPSAPLKSEDMLAAIMGFVGKIRNQDLKKLTTEILGRYKEKLMYYPAAKSNHHSVRSGLLYHIQKMLETSEALGKIYDYVNTDLLFTGVILHDIAKIDEMNASELGIVTEYSMEGELLGHISIGVNLVAAVGKEIGIDAQAILLVQHMILTHHYEAEFGSPKKPGFLEAELLHFVDMIDARIFDVERATKEIAEETYSEPIFSMDRRKMYKHKI